MPVIDELLADLTSGDETRAENAVPGLVELGENAIPALRDLLDSADADQRWWALRTLAQSPQPQTEWLLPLFERQCKPHCFWGRWPDKERPGPGPACPPAGR